MGALCPMDLALSMSKIFNIYSQNLDMVLIVHVQERSRYFTLLHAIM